MIRQFNSLILKGGVQRASIIMTRRPISAQVTPALNPQSLPVPPLNQTLTKFLKSVRPLLSKSQFVATSEEVEKFSKDEGPKLQTLLEARARERCNWLEEWWLNTAYLEYRDPVVLFSSPGLVWPATSFSNERERLEYTTSLISAALSFNAMLDRRSIPQEMSGKSPLDMEQYYKVFGTARIPLSLRDELRFQDPLSLPNHIILMINNNAFSLTVLDEQRKPLPNGVILAMLEQAVKDGAEPGLPVGLLTSENRDRWARASGILSRNVTNVSSLVEIDRSLFVVCLDKPLPKRNARNQQSHTSQLLLHGAGHSNGNAANRWFDKTLQFIVGAGSDGVGISYEHSPAEGNPIGVLADFVISRLEKREGVEPASRFPNPKKLNFELVPAIEDALTEAGAHIDRLAADLDVFGFKFGDFGKNQLKALKTSPDSFIQIAIQYAFYKIHRSPAAQYESGTLRRYRGGRTDVIRTCSEESFAFCKSEGSNTDRSPLLVAALNAHKNYANDAISARGVDRHLLGLKLIAKENGIKLPKFYSDPGYVESTNFKLSTSNVPARADALMIYAPLVDNGYACCYNPRDLDINFGTSSWNHCSVTDTDKFANALKEALNEMRTILAAGQSQKSKL